MKISVGLFSKILRSNLMEGGEFLKRELSVPMVFVTHRPAELLLLADECIVLAQGAVVEQGAPVDVLERPRVAGVGSLVGVDNLLRMEVLEHDERVGTTRIGTGALELSGPVVEAPAGAKISVGFYADDVLLSLERPATISARNALECTVRELHRIGHEIIAELDVDEADRQ